MPGRQTSIFIGIAAIACVLLVAFQLLDKSLLAVAIAVSMWLTPQVPAELIGPVRTYTGVISLMVIMALAAHGAGASVLIVIGALLFYLSDLSVAAMQFAEPPFPTYILGLPLYYAGQLCLAVSVARPRAYAS